MSASLEELRPAIKVLLDLLDLRMAGNGSIELHFHEGEFLRWDLHASYRPEKRGTPLDRRRNPAQDTPP